MLKHASWIHGNAMHVEDTSFVNVRRMGWGTELLHTFPQNFTPPGSWCHIPIPTPVILDGARVRVQTLFLLFKTGQHAAIDNIHVFDGPRRIANFDVIPGSNYSARRTGNYSQGVAPQNTITLPSVHEVALGLSISFTFRPVALSVDRAPTDPEGSLLITSAGADFF
jgi:hypothetical protein